MKLLTRGNKIDKGFITMGRPGTGFNTWASTVRGALLAAPLWAATLMPALPTAAAETDNHTLSPEPLEDVGPFLSRQTLTALDLTVTALNQKISSHCRKSKPCRYQQHEELYNTLRKRVSQYEGTVIGFFFGPAYEYGQLLIRELGGAVGLSGRPLSFQPDSHIFAELGVKAGYVGSFAKKNLVPTISIYDVKVGLDKMIHFHNEGSSMAKIIHRERARGRSEDEAIRTAVQDISIEGEEGIFGLASVGVYSNADAATNMAGMHFYLNLTEAVFIGETPLPPILELRDGLWTINPHRVAMGDQFLAPFVSLHWNEAMNANVYSTERMLQAMRRVVKTRCPQWRDSYPDRKQSEYIQLETETQDWFGIDYGHRGNRDQKALLSELCF